MSLDLQQVCLTFKKVKPTFYFLGRRPVLDVKA